MSNRVTHFEIPSANPERSRNFFKDVFGWTFQQMSNEPYWFAISGDEKTPGINGAIMKEVAPGQPVINTITVDDIDSMLIKVAEQGGKVVKPKWPIPNIGWIAFFSDPDGNMHGIMQLHAKAK